MNDKNDNTVKNSASDIGVAAISGGGTGTLLLYLAQSLPDSNRYKSLFVMLAPSAAVVVTSFWVWATAEFSKRRREKQVERTIAEMLELLHKKIADPSVPQKQKKVYEKQLAILEEKNFQRRLRIIDE